MGSDRLIYKNKDVKTLLEESTRKKESKVLLSTCCRVQVAAIDLDLVSLP